MIYPQMRMRKTRLKVKIKKNSMKKRLVLIQDFNFLVTIKR
jgi:hypothetical protein